MSGIEGKVIAITGASSGIGAATATYLAEKGARLVLGARREDRLNAVVDQITSQGGSAVGLVIDVTRREDLKRLTDTAMHRLGRLDVLVSNAGTMAVSPFDELRQDDWDAMVATHITGLLNGIGAALPIFRRQRSGQFVNVASTAAYVVKSPQAVYAATKNAVRTVLEGLRQESTDGVVRTTAVSPGFVNTELDSSIDNATVREEIRRNMDAFGMPPEAVAEAIAFAVDQPSGVEIGEIIVRPTLQN